MTPKIEKAIDEGIDSILSMLRPLCLSLEDMIDIQTVLNAKMRKVAWAAFDEVASLSAALERVERERCEGDSLEKFQRELQDYATVLGYARSLRDALAQIKNMKASDEHENTKNA